MKYLIDGKIYDPIKCGDAGDWYENDPPDAHCGDCGCEMGEYHLRNCDIERCPACHGQFISCSCGTAFYLTNAEAKDEIYLSFLKHLQKQENSNFEKAVKLLMDNKITMKEYMEMATNKPKDILSPVDKDETSLDFLERLYNITKMPISPSKKYDLVLNTSIEFANFNEKLSKVGELAESENVISVKSISDRIKSTYDVNEVNIYSRKTKLKNDHKFYRENKDSVRALRNNDVKQIVDNIASYVVKQLEREEQNIQE